MTSTESMGLRPPQVFPGREWPFVAHFLCSICNWYAYLIDVLQFSRKSYKWSQCSFQSERVLNSNDIVFTLLMIFWAFVALLGFCMLGEIVTNEFDTFYEGLCNKNWYFFPIELQRMLVIFMPMAQKSVTIHGSGTTLYRLAAFKKVNAWHSIFAKAFLFNIPSLFPFI